MMYEDTIFIIQSLSLNNCKMISKIMIRFFFSTYYVGESED